MKDDSMNKDNKDKNNQQGNQANQQNKQDDQNRQQNMSGRSDRQDDSSKQDLGEHKAPSRETGMDQDKQSDDRNASDERTKKSA